VNSSERGDGQVLPYSISAFWVSGAPLFDQRSHHTRRTRRRLDTEIGRYTHRPDSHSPSDAVHPRVALDRGEQEVPRSMTGEMAPKVLQAPPAPLAYRTVNG
jgi:hypothetical protein